jgi:Ca2+-dependent lipid-binding protein
MPASIKKNYKQLHFRIIRGEKLPETDTFGTIDAYIKTTFNSKTIKTDIIKMKDDVV